MKKYFSTESTDRVIPEVGRPLRSGGNDFKTEAMVIIKDDEKFLREMLNAIEAKLQEHKSFAVSSDDILSSKEVQDLLHISPKQFYQLRKEGRIAYSQVGRKIYVKRSEIERYINAHKILNK